MMHRSIAIAAAAAALASSAVQAHDGHGASGPHVHAGDVLGLLAAIVVVGLALWLRRK